ncbi:hypothetical protein B0J13DRAFT_639385 [Dactylonectria estremocensis]|uniref:DUF7136 domain-containing protein n=1 Tax=Dactylonectria estremocensis TaxID=1079267 RepID=A0A9P9IY44_9HYPO|nr:hypothetical protein B0J13DRAFT_639385 [Dactylonectria estremocensis]
MRLLSKIAILMGVSVVDCLHHQERRDKSPFPVDLELVLIFPRPNESYYPVYPFPVVFAISGAAALWPYGFNVRWSLESSSTTGGRRSLESWSLAPSDYTSGSLDPAAEPYYYISGSEVFVNSSASDWTLGWTVSIPQECYPLGDYGNYQKSGSMIFSTSLNGTLPNMTGEVVEAERIRFLDHMKTPKNTQGTISSNKCLVVDKGTLTGDFNEINTGSRLEAAVTSTMLDVASCPSTAAWPDVANLQNDESCKQLYPDFEDDDSAGVRVLFTGFWAFLVALLSCVFVL